jgi:hypothetical protein
MSLSLTPVFAGALQMIGIGVRLKRVEEEPEPAPPAVEIAVKPQAAERGVQPAKLPEAGSGMRHRAAILTNLGMDEARIANELGVDKAAVELMLRVERLRRAHSQVKSGGAAGRSRGTNFSSNLNRSLR